MTPLPQNLYSFLIPPPLSLYFFLECVPKKWNVRERVNSNDLLILSSCLFFHLHCLWIFSRTRAAANDFLRPAQLFRRQLAVNSWQQSLQSTWGPFSGVGHCITYIFSYHHWKSYFRNWQSLYCCHYWTFWPGIKWGFNKNTCHWKSSYYNKDPE